MMNDNQNFLIYRKDVTPMASVTVIIKAVTETISFFFINFTSFL